MIDIPSCSERTNFKYCMGLPIFLIFIQTSVLIDSYFVYTLSIKWIDNFHCIFRCYMQMCQSSSLIIAKCKVGGRRIWQHFHQTSVIRPTIACKNYWDKHFNGPLPPITSGFCPPPPFSMLLKQFWGKGHLIICFQHC
jgi:hypothetical protein